MKRGGKCIAQTINLSNPETCIRPKRIQKLVAADAMQPCPGTGPGGSSHWTPRPVAIKVCSWKDMQRTCPPKLCDCPQKAKPRTAGQKFSRAVLFLLKSSIAAGLVYWTHSEGLWGSSSDVEDLYYRILATIAPALPDGDDVNIIPANRVPSTSEQKSIYSAKFCLHGEISSRALRIMELTRDIMQLVYVDFDVISIQCRTDVLIELPRFGRLKYSIIDKYNHAVFSMMNCIMNASTTLQQRLQNFLCSREEAAEEESSEDLSQPGDNGSESNETIEDER